ncbi:hypothetical protein Y032_0254g291 [Ancylostoma ceylanicum]|nr:hypothetical protein Y032_0254g291 [Ancylostoma ceylanicum]
MSWLFLCNNSLFRYRYTHNVEQGEGVAVLFHQFLANAGDCVTACDVNSVCQSTCGDVMDHPKTKKILITNSSATITMQSTAPADGNYHTGIYAKSISFDLATRTYFDCNSTVDLKDGEPFFLVSQNYPNTPYQFSRCEVTFAAVDAIRVAIYDLVTVNSVLFKGVDISGKPVEVRLSGRHVTDDEPVALYFLKSLQVSFAPSNRTTSYSRGFYILVDSFKRGSASSEACMNNGAVTVHSGQTVLFGTANFGSGTYPPNMQCSYSFSSDLKDHLLAISMEFETEKCCDVMFIDGIAPPPYNLYNYQGFMQRTFQFASTQVITMNFTSDGTVQGVGFNGSVYNIDCACGSGVYQLTPNDTLLQITSPGFLHGAPTYCPELNCFWTIKFPVDYEVMLNISDINLRTGSQQDQFVIADNFARVLLSTNSTTYYGPTRFIITSGQVSINFTSASTMVLSPPLTREGFLVDLRMVKKYIRRTVITFTDDSFMADISTRSFVEGLNVTYEYSITARPGKKVTTHFFTTLNGIANLEIYDGSDTSAAMIDTSFLYNLTTMDGVPMSVRSTGEKLLVRVRPNLFNTKEKLDFQAMVTDWSQGTHCTHGINSTQPYGREENKWKE